MNRRNLGLACLLVSAIALLAPATSFAAPCYSSTPNAATHFDSATDSELGLAPELTSTYMNVDAACNMSVAYEVAGQPSPLLADFYSWYIDTDGNPLTGVLGGGDMAVALDGSLGTALLQYSNGSWSSLKTLPRLGPFSVGFSVSDLGIVSPATPRFYGGAFWSGTYDDYFDFVPEPDAPSIPLSVVFSSSPPVVTQSACVVPRVKGLSYRAARTKITRAGCKVSGVFKRTSRRYNKRALKTVPRAGTTMAFGSSVDLYVGKKPRKRSRRSLAGPIENLEAIANRMNHIDLSR